MQAEDEKKEYFSEHSGGTGALHHSWQMSFTNAASLKSLFGPEMPEGAPLYHKTLSSQRNLLSAEWQGLPRLQTLQLWQGIYCQGSSGRGLVASLTPMPWVHLLGREGGGRADTFQRLEAAKCVVAQGELCLGSPF